MACIIALVATADHKQSRRRRTGLPVS